MPTSIGFSLLANGLSHFAGSADCPLRDRGPARRKRAARVAYSGNASVATAHGFLRSETSAAHGDRPSNLQVDLDVDCRAALSL
jgi:hypothetical protein